MTLALMLRLFRITFLHGESENFFVFVEGLSVMFFASLPLFSVGGSMSLATGRRYGDSRHWTAPSWQFSSEARPLVGTSRTYLGKEIEANNDNKISGLSPGPMYLPSYRQHKPPAYSFGQTRTDIDKRDSPGPANYKMPAAPALGFQRIDSSSKSDPRWGFGSSTRETREAVHVAKGRLFSNNLPSHVLLGGSLAGFGASIPPFVEEPIRKWELPDFAERANKNKQAAAKGATSSSSGSTQPSRTKLTRALAVAMVAAEQTRSEADPKLAAALTTLRQRVQAIDATSTKKF
jgi:hypothetical protein